MIKNQVKYFWQDYDIEDGEFIILYYIGYMMLGGPALGDAGFDPLVKVGTAGLFVVKIHF